MSHGTRWDGGPGEQVARSSVVSLLSPADRPPSDFGGAAEKNRVGVCAREACEPAPLALAWRRGAAQVRCRLLLAGGRHHSTECTRWPHGHFWPFYVATAAAAQSRADHAFFASWPILQNRCGHASRDCFFLRAMRLCVGMPCDGQKSDFPPIWALLTTLPSYSIFPLYRESQIWPDSRQAQCAQRFFACPLLFSFLATAAVGMPKTAAPSAVSRCGVWPKTCPQNWPQWAAAASWRCKKLHFLRNARRV